MVHICGPSTWEVEAGGLFEPGEVETALSCDCVTALQCTDGVRPSLKTRKKGCWYNWIFTCIGIKSYYFTPYTKVNSKYINRLGMVAYACNHSTLVGAMICLRWENCLGTGV